ncbi:MAG: phosphodiester glycosidase family protein [Clostridia bacterium]|nr:phosphodiester glycosidase family protein [Clostridia bacterium]
MNRTILRLIAIALFLLLLPLLISSPALAEAGKLPLDQLVPGSTPLAEGYLSDTEYLDDTIHVTTEEQIVGKLPCHIVRIKIEDPSQIRTCMSKDRYEDRTYVKAETMAEHVNAIAAVNGDFFKYYYEIGYVVRQGVEYRRECDGTRDVLMIDDLGDFHYVLMATNESLNEFLENEFPEDRQVINSFTFGPVLVIDGQPFKDTITDLYQSRYKMQRVAIVQLGELEYAIVECDGKSDASYGMSLEKFSEYIAELFPDCKVAYNLDGGGSTNVIFNNKRIHKNVDLRKISDILYFASAHEE